MNRKQPSVHAAMSAVAIATLGALATALGLAHLAAPRDMRPRLEALAGQAQHLRSDLQPVASAPLIPAGAICRDTEAAAKTLRDSLTGAANQAGLGLEMIDARADVAANGTAKLAAVRLRFTATGSYESVIGLIAALSRQRPELFADNVDIVSKTSNVSLTFSGRAFCTV